jgi:hypothetical protein
LIKRSLKCNQKSRIFFIHQTKCFHLTRKFVYYIIILGDTLVIWFEERERNSILS